MKKKIIQLILVLLISSSVKAQFLKGYGATFSLGTPLSPNGYIGFNANAYLNRSTEITSGLGGFPNFRFCIGIRQYFLLSKHVQPMISLLYCYDMDYTVVFNENSPNERFYHYGSANSIKPNIGVVYNFNSDKEKIQTLLWMGAGYNFRLSDYYINLQNSTLPADPGEINKIEKRIFNNAPFFNAGITFKIKKT